MSLIELTMGYVSGFDFRHFRMQPSIATATIKLRKYQRTERQARRGKAVLGWASTLMRGIAKCGGPVPGENGCQRTTQLHSEVEITWSVGLFSKSLPLSSLYSTNRSRYSEIPNTAAGRRNEGCSKTDSLTPYG